MCCRFAKNAVNESKKTVFCDNEKVLVGVRCQHLRDDRTRK